jgi:hypothetical protein
MRLNAAVRWETGIYLNHVAGKAVPVSGKRFDPFHPVLSQDLSQCGNLESEVSVFNERVRPQGRHQLLFREDPAFAFD